MGRQNVRDKVIAKHSSRFQGLHFEKTGKQIKESVRGLLNDMETELRNVYKKAEPLCLKHELLFKEILDEEKERRENPSEVSVYGTMDTQYAIKASQRVPGLRSSQNKLQEIQADMNELAVLAHQVFTYQEEKGNLGIIIDHLDDQTYFSLTYDELAELGF